MFYLNMILLVFSIVLVVLIFVQFFTEAPTLRIHANRGKVTMIIGFIVVLLIYAIHKENIHEYDKKYLILLGAFFLSFFVTGWYGYLTYHKNEEFMLKHKMFAYLTMGLLFINLAIGIIKLI